MSSKAIDTPEIQIGAPEETEPCHQKVRISIPAALVDATYERVERNYLQNARLPGFRPGKTPLNLLRRKFEKKISEDVRSELLNSAFRQALTADGVKPITLPNLDGGEDELQAKRGSDLAFTIDFDVAPSFELPTYTKLALNKPALAVSEEQVEAFIDNFRRQRATLGVVDRPAAAGDILRVSYTTVFDLADGEEIPEPAKRLLQASEQWLMLQEPEIIPGIIDGLQGAKAGDDVTLAVSFPNDYQMEPFLGGKSATYTFSIIEVNAHEMPEVTDEFAKGLGMESADALRDVVRERLASEVAQRQQQVLHDQIFELLIDGQDFPLPPNVFARERASVFHELHHQHHQQHDHELPAGEEPSHDDDDHKALEARAAAEATNRLRFQYIVERIAQAEDISVSDEEVRQGLEYLRHSRGMTEQRFEQTFNIDALASSMRWDFLRNRTLSKLVEMAEVTEEAAPADNESAAPTDTDATPKKKAVKPKAGKAKSKTNDAAGDDSAAE